MTEKQKTINIKYPFTDTKGGTYIDLNTTTKDAIKSDFLHLILTKKSRRWYKPDFGTNLYKLIFEQNDPESAERVREEIETNVAKYIPGLTIDNIEYVIENNKITVNINFTVSQGLFLSRDFVSITF